MLMQSAKKILIAIMTIALFFATGCTDESDSKDLQKSKASSGVDNKGQISHEENQANGQDVNGKYFDNEVYTGDDGKEYSKTEEGTEVEITGDNLKTLMEEYEKVKGTGSEREKELLEQLQVIIDIMSDKSPQ